MKAKFLISTPAYSRLGHAAGDRGWCSDPDYAVRTVERVLARSPAGAACEIGGRRIEDLAALSGEFPGASLEDVIAAITRFFGEPPRCVEAERLGYAVVATLAAGAPPPA